jgi:hypothetical protein
MAVALHRRSAHNSKLTNCITEHSQPGARPLYSLFRERLIRATVVVDVKHPLY